MKNRGSIKYVYLCVAVVLIILSTLFFQSDTEDNGSDSTGILGVVYDIRTSAKGYTFSFEDTEGKTIRCFSYDEPANNVVYAIKGETSYDGSMLFIRSMQRVNG
jgi:hypothetical protein